MSVSASVFCLKCREFAPRIGDGGAVGFPSLKDTPDLVTGDYQTFGYLKKGFDAIGYRSWELEAIAAFLKAHSRHKISLFLDDQDVRYDYDDEDDPRAVDDVSDATRFEFDDDDFVEGLFEVACEKCAVSMRTGTERLRPMKPMTLKPAAIQDFLSRVRGADGQNFHRVSGVLDYYADQDRWARFLNDHAAHGVNARIVQEDSSHAGRRGPTWKLAWHQPGNHRPIQPLITDAQVIVVGPALNADGMRAVIHAYGRDGEVRWKRQLAGGVSNQPHLVDEGVLVHEWSRETSSHTIQCLDLQSGEVVSSRATSYAVEAWLPGGRAFAASRYNSDEGKRLAIVDWPSASPRWEFPDAGAAKVTVYGIVANSDVAVMVGEESRNRRTIWTRCVDAASGRQRWHTSLAEYGEYLSGYLSWRDWFLIGIDRKLVAVDLEDGRVAWQCDAPFSNWHESDDLLRGHSYEKFFVLDLMERKLRFAVNRDEFGPPPRATDRNAGHTVAAGGEILVVEQPLRTLFALDASTGRLLWKHRPKPGVTGTQPAVSRDRIVYQGETGVACYVRTGS